MISPFCCYKKNLKSNHIWARDNTKSLFALMYLKSGISTKIIIFHSLECRFNIFQGKKNDKHFVKYCKNKKIFFINSLIDFLLFRKKGISSALGVYRKTKRKTTNNHRRCSIKKAVPENFTILSGKQLCLRLILIKS